ncbi:uncharacterized protein RCC_03949 [Ramularia collo-cygni]|uniref:Uncharacterized protein n=1 Tax=Ramularia collo-cygni TaxID=112498 RepID=A0A2D3V9B5_9PEZI|nr:uncharacterized protein RCC_03949 [Ramularia collo-cygni]CZT18109.1 uncharacterized protein RCC_03949 [Ramularia collo-cygni]
MQFFATIMSMAFAIAAVSAHDGETHYTNTTVAPTYGTPNSTISATGTGAPFPSSTGPIDNAAGKLSTSALGLFVVGGIALAL